MLYVVAWLGHTGWTAWHMPKLFQKWTLCGKAIPDGATYKVKASKICMRCVQKFFEPLL